MTRQIVAFDTETELIRPAKQAAELVCISYQRPGFDPQLVHAGGIDDRAALELVTSWLTTDTLIVGHNVAYDNAVLCHKWPHLIPLVFRAYDEDRVDDTMLRQKLLDIAEGCYRGKLHKFSKEVVQEDGTVEVVTGARWEQHNYGLADLTRRCLGRILEKDEWRLRYGEFKNTPITQWPDGARLYPLEDARATLDVFTLQTVHEEYIEDRFRQSRAAWALFLTQTWGLRTHEPGVDKLERETIAALAEIEGGLKDAGLVRRDGSRDTRRAQARMVAACKAAGRPVRLTAGGEKQLKEFKAAAEESTGGIADTVYEAIAAKGGVSLDSDACEASDDAILEDYAELTSLKAVLNKDLPMLRAGVTYPVHTSFNLTNSGRVSSSRPNVQNPRRLPGIREAFIPRAGKVYAQADFAALELHGLAQVCLSLFGESELARILNAGVDPHTDFAATMMGIPYEEAVALYDAGDKKFENERQTAKSAAFGFCGGLGPDKFCLFARKSYQVTLTRDRAKELKVQWVSRLPEMQRFFAYNGEDMNDEGEGIIRQLFSNRWRGGCRYTAKCNGWIQGIGSDAAKRATYLVSRACYAEPDSVLYGSRIVNMIHDELLVEVNDDEYAHDKAVEMSRLMEIGANEFLPDVPTHAKPQLARCWSKKAKAVYDKGGRLVPWAP